MKEFGRRHALTVITGMAAIPLVAACETPAPRVQLPETRSSGEGEKLFTPGSVAQVENTFYLFRNDKMYPFSSQDFEVYRRLTKFDKYKRKVTRTSRSAINSYEEGIVPTYPSDPRASYIEPFAGMPKNLFPKGGEMNIFLFGFLDSSGYPYTPVRPKDSFAQLYGSAGLARNGWRDGDNVFHTHGVKGIEEYDIQRAISDPAVNIQETLGVIKQLKEDLPQVQVNLYGHSLGGLVALEITRAHPDMVNNLFLYAAPVNGLNPEFDRKTVVAAFKASLLQYGLDTRERVSDFLFSLYSQERKEQTAKFAREFKESGKNIRSWVYGIDPVIPVESTINDTVVIGEEKRYGLSSIREAAANKWAHGAPLQDRSIIEQTCRDVGENLAA